MCPRNVQSAHMQAAAEQMVSTPQNNLKKALTRRSTKAAGDFKAAYVLTRGSSTKEGPASTLVKAQDAADPTEAHSLILPLSTLVAVVTRHGEMVGFFVEVPHLNAETAKPAARMPRPADCLTAVLLWPLGSALHAIGTRKVPAKETAGANAAARASTPPSTRSNSTLSTFSTSSTVESKATGSKDKADPAPRLLREHGTAAATDTDSLLTKAASSSRPLSLASSFKVTAGKDKDAAHLHTGVAVVGNEIAHAMRGITHAIGHHGVHLSASDTPPAGCPGIRFVQVTRINTGASVTAKQLASLGVTTKGADELVGIDENLLRQRRKSLNRARKVGKREPLIRTAWVEFEKQPFSSRAVALADVSLEPAEAAAQLRAALQDAGKADGVLGDNNRTIVEAYGRISEHELTWAAHWSSEPKVWSLCIAWGLQLLLAAGMLAVVILYSFTDSKLAFTETWLNQVLVATAETFGIRVLVAEPLVTVTVPIALLLLRCLPEEWRNELFDQLLAPLVDMLQAILRFSDKLSYIFGT
mmetsp:Transcript_17677/g.41114  ORF Transcript_17677/g.41114 Transcript_17677/m.41114 type:complete len:529 (-) Transcript_17677:148-1734(-)